MCAQLCPVAAAVPLLPRRRVGAEQVRFIGPHRDCRFGGESPVLEVTGLGLRFPRCWSWPLPWVPRVLPESLSRILSGNKSPTPHLCFPPTWNGVETLLSQDSRRKRCPGSILHISQRGGTAQELSGGQVGKENVVYPCSGILAVVKG